MVNDTLIVYVKKKVNVFHHLTLAVRDRVIRELRDFWSDHPRYPDFAQIYKVNIALKKDHSSEW